MSSDDTYESLAAFLAARGKGKKRRSTARRSTNKRKRSTAAGKSKRCKGVSKSTGKRCKLLAMEGKTRCQKHQIRYNKKKRGGARRRPYRASTCPFSADNSAAMNSLSTRRPFSSLLSSYMSINRRLRSRRRRPVRRFVY